MFLPSKIFISQTFLLTSLGNATIIKLSTVVLTTFRAKKKRADVTGPFQKQTIAPEGQEVSLL